MHFYTKLVLVSENLDKYQGKIIAFEGTFLRLIKNHGICIGFGWKRQINFREILLKPYFI